MGRLEMAHRSKRDVKQVNRCGLNNWITVSEQVRNQSVINFWSREPQLSQQPSKHPWVSVDPLAIVDLS